MNDCLHHIRLLGVNIGSWLATIISMEITKDFLQILCLLASLSVSLASIWWIKHQAKVFDEKNQPPKL